MDVGSFASWSRRGTKAGMCSITDWGVSVMREWIPFSVETFNPTSSLDIDSRSNGITLKKAARL